MDIFCIRHYYEPKKNFYITILELFWGWDRKKENLGGMVRNNKEETQREITSNLQILQMRQILTSEKQPQ